MLPIHAARLRLEDFRREIWPLVRDSWEGPRILAALERCVKDIEQLNQRPRAKAGSP